MLTWRRRSPEVSPRAAGLFPAQRSLWGGGCSTATRSIRVPGPGWCGSRLNSTEPVCGLPFFQGKPEDLKCGGESHNRASQSLCVRRVNWDPASCRAREPRAGLRHVGPLKLHPGAAAMGSCVGRQRREGQITSGNPRKRAGRNEPLKKDRPKWKSDYPMTDGQLRSKRDEFWDTAPAFEGRKEIWDALKAAACAVEANDHGLAQAIIDGAGVTLPHGSLTECYDELGNRYQLPVYCLAPPINLIMEWSEEEGAEPSEPAPNTRREFPLKVRLSSGKDLRLNASMTDTIGQLKKQLYAQEGLEPAWQRWFFSGKLLTDRTRLQETKIQKDFVIQVIVNQPTTPRN